MHGWYILTQHAKRNESYTRVADISERYVMMAAFYLTAIYTSLMRINADWWGHKRSLVTTLDNP